MPNGHGGIPRFGSPALLLLLTGLAAWLGTATGMAWLLPVCILLAGLFGWRLSYHLHMWGVTEYGGHAASEEEKERAKGRYRLGIVAYALVAAAVLAWLVYGAGF